MKENIHLIKLRKKTREALENPNGGSRPLRGYKIHNFVDIFQIAPNEMAKLVMKASEIKLESNIGVSIKTAEKKRM